MARILRRSLSLGLLCGLCYGVWKTVRSRREAPPWEPWVSTGASGATAPSVSSAVAAEQSPTAQSTGPSGSSNGEALAAAPAEESSGNGSALESADSRPARPAPSRPPARPRTGPARKAPTGRAEDPGKRLWVPANDGVCPQSHPVKAKLSSKIFHVPGARNYNRTRADRCYPDEQAAIADGLRPALR